MSIAVAVGWAFVLISLFAGVIIGLTKLEEWVDRTEGEEYSEYHDEHTKNTNH